MSDTTTATQGSVGTVDQPAPVRRTGGDVLVEVMRRHGIDTAFGVISIHNLPLVEAVARDLRFVEVRHEAAAVNAADAYARATGGIGVALTSTGTGAGNAAGSMVEALTAGSRVLHVTGQIESEFLGSSRGVIHEVPRQLQMLEAVSSYASTILEGNRVEEQLERALEHILQAPHGPASVEWPTDLQYLARPENQLPFAPRPRRLEPVDESSLEEAVRLLRAAERPLIWVGGGAASAGEPLEELLRFVRGGLLTSNSGRGIVPEDHPQVIGNFASDPGLRELLAEADLLLSVGTHFRSNETKSYHLPLPTPHIQIDIDPAALGRVYPADVAIEGDAYLVLNALVERLDSSATGPDWRTRVRETREKVREDLFAYIGGYADICRGIREVLPRESVVARDVTIPSSQWGNRLLEFYRRESNIFPVGGGIGQGLAMGIGASLGCPDAPTLVMVGDGGLAVHLGELASLAGARPWCTVVVFNDGGYGVLRNMQAANGFQRSGVDLFTPNFGDLAHSLDLPYWLVRDSTGFADVLRKAVATRGPAIIEVDVESLTPPPGPFVPPVHIPQDTEEA
jgi:acetolactate synthase-1/2/3 large subunit